MMVRIRAFARFREIAGEEACFDLKEGSTLRDLLKVLSSTHPKLADDLFSSDGTVGDGVTILRNRKGLNLSTPQKTILEDGDEVALLPPFSGG
jgi:molybdopterin synthase sulfur carrier subunit